MILFEPNPVSKYRMDKDDESMGKLIYIPLLAEQVRLDVIVLYFATMRIWGAELTATLTMQYHSVILPFQIVQLIGTQQIYLVNGQHSRHGSCVFSYAVCSLEVLYFLNSALKYSLFPRIPDLTAVRHTNKWHLCTNRPHINCDIHVHALNA